MEYVLFPALIFLVWTHHKYTNVSYSKWLVFAAAMTALLILDIWPPLDYVFGVVFGIWMVYTHEVFIPLFFKIRKKMQED